MARARLVRVNDDEGVKVFFVVVFLNSATHASVDRVCHRHTFFLGKTILNFVSVYVKRLFRHFYDNCSFFFVIFLQKDQNA